MANNGVVEAHIRLDSRSDEYCNLVDALVPVLQEHFVSCVKFDARQRAEAFLDDYDVIMETLWTNVTAVNALDDLKRALAGLKAAYKATPKIVLEELVLNKEHVVEAAKEQIIKDTKADMIFWSLQPLPKVKAAAEALDTLSDHCEALVASIEFTRKSLPEGFKTRNRPLKEWALIQAAAYLVREFDAIKIPKDMDESGDMYRLLRDIFLVFEIEKPSFKGVYRGWKKNMDGIYENADLLTI